MRNRSVKYLFICIHASPFISVQINKRKKNKKPLGLRWLFVCVCAVTVTYEQVVLIIMKNPEEMFQSDSLKAFFILNFDFFLCQQLLMKIWRKKHCKQEKHFFYLFKNEISIFFVSNLQRIEAIKQL